MAGIDVIAWHPPGPPRPRPAQRMPSPRTPCHGPLTSRRQRSEARKLALLPRPFSLLSPLPSPLPHWTPPPPNWTHSPKKWTHCPQKLTHRAKTGHIGPSELTHPGHPPPSPAIPASAAGTQHPNQSQPTKATPASQPSPAHLRPSPHRSLLAAHSALSPGEPALSPSKEPDPASSSPSPLLRSHFSPLCPLPFPN